MSNKTEITKSILLGIGAAAAIGFILVFPNTAQLFKWLTPLLNDDYPRARSGMYHLRRRGLIKTKRRNNMVHLVLTEKGKARLAYYKIRSLSIAIPKRWDGFWRIVMFDIPERDHDVRDAIRDLLKKMGFIRLQMSVFIQPYPCIEVIKELRVLFSLEPGCLYLFEVSVLEGEDVLKRHFSLF